MKISIILGTRPEIIKMSPIIRECLIQNIPFFILHTGQHYSFDMDKIFFDELEIPKPEYNLDVGSGSHAIQSAKILTGVEEVLLIEKPDVVLVQGDTNTVMAGAIAAAKIHIPIGHVEAGLRSFDRNMPEEINRIIADHISDFLFAPSEDSRNALLHEGIQPEKIMVTGNTIVDAIYQNSILSHKGENILNSYGLRSKKYVLVTTHRAENVDSPKKLADIFYALNEISTRYKYPVILPIHPRTKKMIDSFSINRGNIILTDPVGYLDFLSLEKNARVILSDSGGIQEEACILKIPCITLRDNTERPETISVGSNILAGTNPETIIKCFSIMYDKATIWKNPYGDGHSSQKIINYLKEVLNSN